MKKLKYSKNWKPCNENNEITFKDFNKRFPIDQHFIYDTMFNHYRIRFVKHPNLPEDHVKVFINKLPRKLFFWKWKNNELKLNYVDSFYMYEGIVSLDDCKKIFGIIL